MKDVKVDKVFERMSQNWKKRLERTAEIKFTIEDDAFNREDGERLEVRLQPPPAWAISVFRNHNANTDHGLFAAGYIVAVTRDFFGNPFFYDDVDETGEEYSIDEKLEQMNQSKERMCLYNEGDDLLQIANGMLNTLTKSKENFTPEEVKPPSTPESQT